MKTGASEVGDGFQNVLPAVTSVPRKVHPSSEVSVDYKLIHLGEARDDGKGYMRKYSIVHSEASRNNSA